MTTQARQHPRRTLVLAAGLLAVAGPALTACGSFDYATDRPNVIANGGYSLDTDVRVNAARIVTSAEGTGIFIATFALNPSENAAGGEQKPALTGLQPASDATDTVQTSGPVDVKIGDDGMVNLADPSVGGVPVTGDFKPGDSVPLMLTFSSSQTPVRVQVPVVTQCGPYASVAAGGSGTSASATSSDTSSDSASPSASDPMTDPYSCDHPPAELPSE